MSKKQKQSHKSGAQIKKEKVAEAKVNKYTDQVYMPDVELIITGEQFLGLRHMVFNARGSRMQTVMDVTGKVTGMATLSEKDADIDNLARFIDVLDKQFIDAGKSVHIDVLRTELEKEKVEK